jgi:predicted small secreted protein
MRMRTTMICIVALAGFLLTACNSASHAAAKDALQALRKIEAATQAGVSYMNYQPLVIDAQAKVNEASAKLPDGELKKELSTAMEAYVDAGRAWSKFANDDYLSRNSELGKSLAAKYPIDISTENPAVQRSPVLSTIWEVAKSHVDKASKLLGD